MKTLERGQDKIQRICDKIRHETLEPAKQEAQAVIAAAKKKAEHLVAEAEHQAEQLIQHARAQIEQDRHVFLSSLEQAAKQTLGSLRQDIEQRFFNEGLQDLLAKQLASPQLIANLINGIVKALKRDGIEADLKAIIPHSVSPTDISSLLLDEVCKKLKDKPLEIGGFAGGAQVKLQDKKMTIDLTDQALKELLANYMRKDFRQLIFGL